MAVGKEVGFSLVRESPVASWTRVAWMTHTGAEGQHCPGARFLGFFSDRRLCRRRERWRRISMDVLYERVAGLDVHKDTVVACVRIVADGKTKRECRTFSSTTEQLIELRAWLEECRCTHVAMEATGVYWMPVFRILGEGPFELIVANAAHIKNVPGRKTDVNDATWIADLLACGLIKASCVQNEAVKWFRSLTRTRKQLVREQTRHVQRIEKTLVEANIKLNSVISDIMGASGRRMIEAMIYGVRQPRQAGRRCRQP